MINLLPPKEKKELKKEQTWNKVFLIFGFLVIFLVVLGFIFSLLNSTLSLRDNKIEEKLEDFQLQNFQKTISRTNQELAKINQFWQQQIFVVPLFEKIASLMPPSIYLTKVSFQKEDLKKEGKRKVLVKLYLSGWGGRREDIFNFKQNLEKEKDFFDVYFLPTSWIVPVNVDFSLTLKYQPQ